MAVKIKKTEEVFEEPQKIEEISEKPVEISVVEEKPKEKTVKKKISDIVGLTEVQKQALIDMELREILAKMPGSGYTMVQYTASEGYPRVQSGVLDVSSELLTAFLESYKENIGPITGEQVVRYLCNKKVATFRAYPNISLLNLG